MDDRENFCLGLIATEVSLSLDADTRQVTQYATNANDQGVHVDVGFIAFLSAGCVLERAGRAIETTTTLLALYNQKKKKKKKKRTYGS